MAGTTLDALLRYVGFNSDDRAALNVLHASMGGRLKSVIDRFYESIQTDVEASSVLRDPEQIERLKLSLHGWLDRVLAGPWDLEYFELRERIGHVHVRVGLPQRFMLTAMSVIRQELHAAVAELCPTADAAASWHRALAKILDVDLAIMLETYRADSLDAVRRLEEVERKLLTDELTMSEERYRAVLESAEVIAVAVALDGTVRLFNRQAELVSGRTRTQVLTEQDFRSLWHPLDHIRLEEALASSRTGTASHVFEARLIGEDDKPQYIRWHVTVLPPADSGEVVFIGVDLTGERELALRTRRAEQLANLGTLAAGLAHEIRNPLNAAQLQLTVTERRIRRESSSIDDILEPIAVVRDELGRLATLVSDFLSYARPAPLKLRAIDLRQAVRGVVDLMGPAAEAAGVRLTASGSEVVTAHCDEQQCRQLLINLVKNAIEAASTGGGHVDVSVRRQASTSYLTITDDGPGLPDRMEVFEPFATSKDGGTGLGLPIVQRIVEEHGGSIANRREDGHTLFEIELPVDGPPDPT